MTEYLHGIKNVTSENPSELHCNIFQAGFDSWCEINNGKKAHFGHSEVLSVNLTTGCTNFSSLEKIYGGRVPVRNPHTVTEVSATDPQIKTEVTFDMTNIVANA